MTFFLPKDPQRFRQVFDETCNRIIQTEQDELFYYLFVQLITHLQSHDLIRDVVSNWDSLLVIKQNEYRKQVEDILEYHWLKLWQYHRKSYKLRKELVKIKRIISPPTFSLPSLYDQVCFAMWQFRCCHSPFFRCIYDAPL